MATEVAKFELKAGMRPEDANSAAGQVLKDTLNTLTEQKGFQQAYWGIETENSSVFRLFVDWDSVDDHINFTKAEYANLPPVVPCLWPCHSYYKPFLERFGQIADLNSASIIHIPFKPHPAQQALSDHVSPTTEIGTVYFSSDIPESEQNKFAEAFKQQCENIVKSSEKATGASAGGWAIEEVTIPGTSEKGKVYIGLIGWQTMEDHIHWRNTVAHDENIKLFNQFEKYVKLVDIKHFSGTQINAGAGGVRDVSGPNAPSAQ